jgi:hypothetical protein
VIFTTIGFEPSLKDGGLWLQKVPALGDLQIGGKWVEIDPRLEPRDDETIVMKKGASGFFGTNLASILVAQGVDSVIPAARPTSGCIRATAIDLLQYGSRRSCPRECVGDRAQAPHDANLFDIQAKYATSSPLEDALAYRRERAGRGRHGGVRQRCRSSPGRGRPGGDRGGAQGGRTPGPRHRVDGAAVGSAYWHEHGRMMRPDSAVRPIVESHAPF